ncbi:MAG: hypothetical protein LBQ54_02880 [Planctomycetaceae bacterium]|nr:hypothetical protein [Planctomycetaceae bacterium]
MKNIRGEHAVPSQPGSPGANVLRWIALASQSLRDGRLPMEHLFQPLAMCGEAARFPATSNARALHPGRLTITSFGSPSDGKIFPT